MAEGSVPEGEPRRVDAEEFKERLREGREALIAKAKAEERERIAQAIEAMTNVIWVTDSTPFVSRAEAARITRGGDRG